MAARFVFAGDTAVGEKLVGRLVSAGFEMADDVESADVIFTYYLSQTALEDAYLESGGLLTVAQAGSCFIDLSPSCPTFAKELYALAQMSDVQALDAPLVIRGICDHEVFSHPQQLALYVGGEEKVFEAHREILEAIASQVHYVGMSGCGQTAKASATVIFAAQLVSLIEMESLTKSLEGNASGTLVPLVSESMAPAWIIEVARAIEERHFHGSYSATVLMAEVSAALHCAEDAKLVLPQTEACQHLIELFLVIGGSDLNVPALSLVYGDQAQSDAFGLDWSRAERLYDAHGDDYDLCDDEEEGCGHDHHGHRHELFDAPGMSLYDDELLDEDDEFDFDDPCSSR